MKLHYAHPGDRITMCGKQIGRPAPFVTHTAFRMQDVTCVRCRAKYDKLSREKRWPGDMGRG